MENLEIKWGTKTQIYQSLIPQIASLVDGESDSVANMANVAAAIKMTFNHLWVGFYIVKEDESSFGKGLVLGPFQGPLACNRIAYGKGVCGTAWEEARVVIVPDVDKFPGHIACNSQSRSEIVVPVFKREEVVAVRDIDSLYLNTFDNDDKLFLELVTDLIKL